MVFFETMAQINVCRSLNLIINNPNELFFMEKSNLKMILVKEDYQKHWLGGIHKDILLPTEAIFAEFVNCFTPLSIYYTE